jgi:hypothetical protein
VNQGIELLLARMDSHPAEFAMEDFANDWYAGKWSPVLRQILNRGYVLAEPNNTVSSAAPVSPSVPFLSDEEVMVVYNKFRQLQNTAFTAAVMRILLEGPEQGTMINLTDNTPTSSRYV